MSDRAEEGGWGMNRGLMVLIAVYAVAIIGSIAVFIAKWALVFEVAKAVL